MTCKQLNQNLHVYALSLNGKLAGRVSKLGVDEVSCPYLLSGGRVAELIGQSEMKNSKVQLSDLQTAL
jgi:hypothetical protein